MNRRTTTTTTKAATAAKAPKLDEGAIERQAEEARRVLAEARAYTITTPEQFTAAAELLRTVATKARELEEQRKAITRPIDESKKRVMDLFRGPLDSLEAAGTVLRRAIGAFEQEQEERRRQAQREADEAARKERERLERQAAAAAAKGQEEKAAAITERAATVVPVHVTADVPKVAGVATREVWEFEVVNAAALPREYLVPDEVKLRKVVSALKGDAATAVPGIRVWSRRAPIVGTR